MGLKCYFLSAMMAGELSRKLLIDSFDDSNYQQQLRVSRPGSEHLFSVIKQNLKPDENERPPSIAPQKNILVFLSFISRASSCKTLSIFFGTGRSSIF